MAEQTPAVGKTPTPKAEHSDQHSQPTQWEKRLHLVLAIYNALMVQEFNIVKLARDFKLDADQLRILEFTKRNFTKMVQIFEAHLQDGWSFNRLNFVDQAILLESLAEERVRGTDRKILIDQAVITAKRYSDEGAYQFINGILDQILPKVKGV